MKLRDSRVKRAVRGKLPWLRHDQRLTAAYISRPAFRKHYVISRRQVVRYVTSRRTVLFAPGFPHAGQHCTIVKVLIRLGVRSTPIPERRPSEAVVLWSDTTVVPEDLAASLVSAHGQVINSGCLDIGKDRVEEVHQSVFGYGLVADPRAGGPYLRKSVENSTHDARVFDEPAEPEPGFVYQRVLQNRYPGGLYEEIRLPYVGGCLPVCMLKLKVDERRFKGMPDIDELGVVENDKLYAFANAVPLEFLLSNEETTLVDRFCREMGLDYGELDVVRDIENGRLYVIDVNKTPGGPTIVLGPRDMRRYLDPYAEAVSALLAQFALV